MIFPRLRVINRNQGGFTLVEMIIAVAITGLIGSAVATSIFQTVTLNASNVAHMTAVKEVENAIHYITNDAQMAQSVSSMAPNGFPITMTWVGWDNSTYNVTYSVVHGQLQRSYAVSSVNGGQPSDTIVVAHLNYSASKSQTICNVTPGSITFTITSTVGGNRPSSETRSFVVHPRSGS